MIRKVFLISMGWCSLGLGIAGIFIPLLPTTPLLLLAAVCFFHGSEKQYLWLINHKTFGKPILHFRTHRAISLKAKVVSLLLLWASITSSALLLVPLVWVRVLLFLIATAVSVYLLSLRTLTPAMIQNAVTEHGDQSSS